MWNRTRRRTRPFGWSPRSSRLGRQRLLCGWRLLRGQRLLCGWRLLRGQRLLWRVAAARGPMGALSLAAAVGSMTTRGQRAVPRSPAPRQRQRLLLVRRARRQRAAIPVARAPVLRPIRPAHRTRHPRLNSLIVVPLRGREAPAAERFRCWRARTATARRVLPSSPWRRQPADPEPAPSRGPAVHRQWRGLRSTIGAWATL